MRGAGGEEGGGAALRHPRDDVHRGPATKRCAGRALSGLHDEYQVRPWSPPASPATAPGLACEVLPERGWREVWHDPPPINGRLVCRGPMKQLRGEPDLRIEDGSDLPLWECLECHAKIYAGLSAQRGIVSRRLAPAPPETGS